MSRKIDVPEKIFGWQDGYLSIASFYGGCTYKGCKYIIDTKGYGQPLVREDVMKKLLKARKHQASIPKFQQEMPE